MIIIALWGASNKGKSSTLQKVIDEMGSGAKGFSRLGEKEVGEGLFTYRNKKIAITTAGDSKEILESFFKKYPECDSYVCACRTKGATVAYLKGQPADQLFWYGKTTLDRKGRESGAEEERIFDLINEKQAEYLLEEIIRLSDSK